MEHRSLQIPVELNNSVMDLTPRMKAFEAATLVPLPPVPPREEEGRASGHRVEINYQGDDVRNSTLHHTLFKGQIPHAKSTFVHVDTHESSRRWNQSRNQSNYNDYKLPKTKFPKFTGEHARVWREQCEKYFAMYHAPIHLWVPLATLNFRGNASMWLQTCEAQHRVES